MDSKSSARKIPTKYEYRIDNILYYLVENTVPLYYKLGLTPNMITMLSFAFALAGLYVFYYNEQTLLGACLLFLGYYWDCCDVYMARKYDMVTKYGDVLDHVTDWLTMALLLYVFWLKKKNRRHFYRMLCIIFVLGALCAVHIGCQEKIYEKSETESPSLVFLTNLCPNPFMIRFTRFFGTGTAQLMLCMMVVYYNHL